MGPVYSPRWPSLMKDLKVELAGRMEDSVAVEQLVRSSVSIGVDVSVRFQFCFTV